MAGGATICGEVSKRIGGRFQPVDLIGYVNDGVHLIVNAIPFPFLFASTSSATNNGTLSSTFTSLNGMTSHQVNICHTSNGVPIPKLTTQEYINIAYATSATGSFKGVGSGVTYNGWTWVTTAGTINIVFAPKIAGNGPNVTVNYYTGASLLLYNNDTPATPWTVQAYPGYEQLDDAVADYAESQIKRLINYVGWEAAKAEFISKIQEVKKKLIVPYEQTGDIEENQLREQAKVQLGRN